MLGSRKTNREIDAIHAKLAQMGDTRDSKQPEGLKAQQNKLINDLRRLDAKKGGKR